MALPEGHRRTDNVHYEEVTIEPSPPPPADIGVERRKISDLDPVRSLYFLKNTSSRRVTNVIFLQMLQAAFKNTKSLNLIQSVVYEKAFGTNSNLLICAPTGAGKTNIAMLCVLRVLKMFTKDGILRKDEFKVRS